METSETFSPTHRIRCTDNKQRGVEAEGCFVLFDVTNKALRQGEAC